MYTSTLVGNFCFEQFHQSELNMLHTLSSVTCLLRRIRYTHSQITPAGCKRETRNYIAHYTTPSLTSKKATHERSRNARHVDDDGAFWHFREISYLINVRGIRRHAFRMLEISASTHAHNYLPWSLAEASCFYGWMRVHRMALLHHTKPIRTMYLLRLLCD